MKKTLVKFDYTPYAYDDIDTHTVRISDTAKSLVFVGNKIGIDNKLKQQLVEINNVGQNVEEFGDYCCYNCSCLTSVNAPSVQKYGNYSFTNSGVSSMPQFENGSVVFSIGDHAFENTQLTSVTLALSGKDILDPADEENGYQGCKLREYDVGPYIGINAFKNCKKLEKVVIKEHPEVAIGMFEGCSALTSVTILSNYGACVGEAVFKDCISLSSITFPENWEIVSQNMFRNCTSLTAVNFDTTSDNAKLITIENNAFNNCTKLSTLVLPKSIYDFNVLNNQSFAGSFLTSITFTGIDDTVFDKYKAQDQKIAIPPAQDQILIPDSSETDTFKYGKWYSSSHTKNIISYAFEHNIPIVIKECNNGCGFCVNFNRHTFNTNVFIEETEKRPYLFVNVIWSELSDADKKYMYALLDGYSSGNKKIGQTDIPWNNREHKFVIFSALWKKQDGTWVAQMWRTNGNEKDAKKSTDDIFSKLDTYFAGYQRDSSYTGETKPADVQPQSQQIITFNGWGLDHNCELYSSNGTKYIFDFATKSIIKN